MPKVKLTERTIESHKTLAKSTGSRVLLWDTQEAGFGCRVSPGGRVSWIVQVWWDGRGGRAKRYTFNAIDLADAREQVPEHRAKLLKKVDLPRIRSEERKQSRQAHTERKATRLGDVVATYFRKKPLEERFWKELQGRFDNQIIPELGTDTPLADITQAQIEELIEAKADNHPVAARTLYEALRPFFKWCVRRKHIAASPLDGVEIPELPGSRDRILTDDEVKLFWSATDGLPFFRDFYRVLLLTAQRREEVSGMRWDEIAGATWTIPGSRTKNGNTHIVHLSPQVKAILDALPRRGEYVFGKQGTGPISGYSKAKRNLDKRLTIPAWRVHDLRRTARSGLAKMRIPKEVASKILNHSSSGKDRLDDVYNRYDYLEERRMALEAWANYVDELVSGETRNNVILMKAIGAT